MRQHTEILRPPANATCAIIILAAGGSSRLGQPKQLLPFRSRSLLRHATETALASVCRPVVVVLGAFVDQLQNELSGLPVKVAFNPLWREGMASSIRAGMEAIAPDRDGPDSVVIMLCDQPLVSAQMLDRLVSVHGSGGGSIVAAEYAGTTGVPALFSKEHFSELGLLEGDQGARKIIVRHEKELGRIPIPEAAFDIDRSEDVRRLEGFFGQKLPVREWMPKSGQKLSK